MKQFDIVLVEFPFSDLIQSKLRPALIISVPGGDNYILCQITTKKRNVQTYEIPLFRSSCQGDIRFDSHIYVDMIFTIHKDIIHKSIGKIKDMNTIKKVKYKILSLFR